MPPKLLVDLATIDLETTQFGPDDIRTRNPHRFELELLNDVITYRPDEGIIVGSHRAQEDAFWVRGHIPGRPIFPGVLMVETAAQLCSFYYNESFPDRDQFFGFGGIENTKFRGQVVPHQRLVIAGRVVQLKARRAIFDTQGFVDGSMVFESRIVGVAV